MVHWSQIQAVEMQIFEFDEIPTVPECEEIDDELCIAEDISGTSRRSASEYWSNQRDEMIDSQIKVASSINVNVQKRLRVRLVQKRRV